MTSSDDASGLHEGWSLSVTDAGAAARPADLTTAATPIALPALISAPLADLDDRDLWLRRSIDAPTAMRLLVPPHGPVGELFVDGEPRLATRNLFRSWEVAVDAGPHELALCLRAPGKVLAERRPRPRWKTRLVAQQQLRFLRTTLLGRIPGWSSSRAPRGMMAVPRLIPAGRLRAEDVALDVRLDGERGRVGITLPAWFRGSAALRVGGAKATLAERDGALGGELLIDDPPRWWPHTHGAQPRLAASLELDGEVLALGQLGFRSIEVDPDRRRFGLCINGTPIFCRGAVHVPSLSTLDFAPTRRVLEALRDAGGNMIRIGGTMRYEDAAFFDACDELGLLVWQDFMFANMDYPVEDATFSAEVTAEVDDQLAAWARHPSLAVLCGGSEVAQQAAMVGQPPERWYGRLFEELLPRRCAARLPGVPYVLGSPCSPVAGDLGGDGVGAPPPLPFRVDVGVAHYYGVGAYLKAFDDARRAAVTFASECLGLSNVPEPESVEALFGDDLVATHVPRWKAGVPRDNGSGWDFEDVRDHYVQGLFGQEALALRYADAEHYLELSRITSAEVMTRVFSEWRRSGSTTRGGLVWFLRDLAPGAGWGLIDVDGREKAPLYALRRVWSPTALLLTDEGSNGLRLHVVHDGPAERRFTLRVALYHRDHEAAVGEVARELVAPPRSAHAYDVEGLFGGFRDVGYSYRFGPRAHDALLATLTDGDTLVGEAAHVPVLSPYPSDPGLTAHTERVDEARYAVTVTTARLALFVALRAAGWRPSAGYFHLAPGETRTVILHARVSNAPAPRGFVHALGAAPARIVGA